MRTTNPGDLAKLNRKRARALVRNLKTALERSENAIHKAAQDMSAGATKTATLSAPPPGLNHPYGRGRFNRRGPRGPMPNGGNPAIINKQTGVFATSWDANGFFNPSRMVIILRNDAPYAGAMRGTRLMVERPILQAVFKSQHPAFMRRFRDALRQAINQ